MKYKQLAVALLLLTIFGCTKYEVQYEGPYEDGQQTSPTSGNTFEIMTVEDGQIHLYHRNLQYAKTLENLPSGIEKAAINFAHDRIAFQVPGQNIEVVDTAGLPLATIPNSANTTWFDWHANNQTLYMLQGFNLVFWGPAVSAAETNLGFLFPLGASSLEMSSAAVTENGSVVAAYRYYGGFSQGYRSKIAILISGSTPWTGLIGSHNLVPWLRTDKTGEQILFGNQTGITTEQVWRLGLSSKFMDYHNDGVFAAISPQGDKVANWEQNELSVYIETTNDWFYFPSNSTTISALDW